MSKPDEMVRAGDGRVEEMSKPDEMVRALSIEHRAV